jgi:hypothetical protein
VNTTGLLAGGVVITALTTCWSYIKSFIWRVISLFIQCAEIDTDKVHYPVVWHLLENYKMSPIYDKVYGGYLEHRVDGRFGLVAYEHFGRHTLVFWAPLWWIFKCPIIVSRVGNASAKGNEDNNNNDDDGNGVFSHITIIRWTIDLDDIFSKACEYRNYLAWEVVDNFFNNQRRFFIKRIPEGFEKSGVNVENSNIAWYQRRHFRLIDEDPNNLGLRNPSHKSSLEQLVFPKHIKDLINEIKLWRTSRSWYQEKGVPWKRGWNLYGPPGTGKTALARAFAEDLDLPLFVYNLAEITSNTDFIKEWRFMQSNVPCIALIEDIDNVFHGRENVTTRRFGMMMPAVNGHKENGNNGSDKSEDASGRWGLTFDCLLNCIDGVERNEGIFLIITTNDLTKIDSALGQPRKNKAGEIEMISTRPGRIDKAIELTYMTNEDKILLAERIIGDCPSELQKMINYVEQNPDEKETPAQFQERCSQIALAKYWEEINGLNNRSFNRLKSPATPLM